MYLNMRRTKPTVSLVNWFWSSPLHQLIKFKRRLFGGREKKTSPSPVTIGGAKREKNIHKTAQGEVKSFGPSTNPKHGSTVSPTTPSTQLLPPIPPTLNPRGELIFSSRVSPHFRDGYERYRAAFEKRRGEKVREERYRRAWFFVKWFLTRPEGSAATTALSHRHSGSVAGNGSHLHGSSGRQKRSRSGSPCDSNSSSATTGAATPRTNSALQSTPTDTRRNSSPLCQSTNVNQLANATTVTTTPTTTSEIKDTPRSNTPSDGQSHQPGSGHDTDDVANVIRQVEDDTSGHGGRPRAESYTYILDQTSDPARQPANTASLGVKGDGEVVGVQTRSQRREACK